MFKNLFHIAMDNQSIHCQIQVIILHFFLQKDESKSATSCMVEYAASSKREPEKVMQSKSSTKTVLFDEDYRCTVVSLKYSLEKVAWIIFILLVLLLITE